MGHLKKHILVLNPEPIIYMIFYSETGDKEIHPDSKTKTKKYTLFLNPEPMKETPDPETRLKRLLRASERTHFDPETGAKETHSTLDQLSTKPANP